MTQILTNPAKQGGRGLALIELLVMIAVVMITLGLLLPSLAMARRTARRVVCATHEKSIGVAIHTYADDMDGSIPYGPRSEPSSIADFYVIDGMVTSQFSLLREGKAVGVGLLVGSYLSRRPESLFCPDTDQPFDADRELARFGQTQAVSSYFYRHGSNTLASLSQPPDTWDDHTQLQQLGTNRNGGAVRALLIDQNFVVGLPVLAFNIVTRTNHQQRFTNALFADGHVETLNNRDDQYTVYVGNSFYEGPEKILAVLEKADIGE